MITTTDPFAETEKKCMRCGVVRLYGTRVQFCREPSERGRTCHGQLITERPSPADRIATDGPRCINCSMALGGDERNVLFIHRGHSVGPFCEACATVLDDAQRVANVAGWDTRKRGDTLGRLRFGTLS